MEEGVGQRPREDHSSRARRQKREDGGEPWACCRLLPSRSAEGFPLQRRRAREMNETMLPRHAAGGKTRWGKKACRDRCHVPSILRRVITVELGKRSARPLIVEQGEGALPSQRKNLRPLLAWGRRLPLKLKRRGGTAASSRDR